MNVHPLTGFSGFMAFRHRFAARHSLTGFWPFRSEMGLLGFWNRFAASKTFWVFDRFAARWAFWVFDRFAVRWAFWVFGTVSLRVRHFGFLTSFHQMRAFCVFEVFCSFTCVLDPYEDLYPFEFWGYFAVLDHYVYNWPLPGIYTLLRFEVFCGV